jgi:hypothetical protein
MGAGDKMNSPLPDCQCSAKIPFQQVVGAFPNIAIGPHPCLGRAFPDILALQIFLKADEGDAYE